MLLENFIISKVMLLVTFHVLVHLRVMLLVFVFEGISQIYPGF